MRYLIGSVFAIAAFLLVMMSMPNTGAIYTHDTQSYEYAASTLIESGELKYFGYDTPIIQWPPFYITIMALIKLAGVPFAQGAAWLNGFLMAYLMYAMALFLFDYLKVKWLAIPALIMMTVSVPLIFISGYAWSEMLFVFLSVLSATALFQYIQKNKGGWFYTAGVLSSLCWLTRYVGIVLVAVLALILFISVKPFFEKIKRTFLYLFISCFPMSLWVLRNYWVSETFTGGRMPGKYTLEENIDLSLGVLESWGINPEPLYVYIAAGLFLFLAIIAMVLKKEKKNKEPGSLPGLLACVLFLVAYAAVILATATTTAMDPINTRLWTPVFPFWILAIVFVMDILLKNVQGKVIKTLMVTGFTVFALIVVINPVSWVQQEGFPRKEVLMGSKEAPHLKNSPVLKLTVETIKPSEDTLIISNNASILSMHSELKCYYPPKKKGIPLYLSDRYNERIENFKTVYLVWGGSKQSNDFVDVPDYQEEYEMEPVAHNKHCVIYKIR